MKPYGLPASHSHLYKGEWDWCLDKTATRMRAEREIKQELEEDSLALEYFEFESHFSYVCHGCSECLSPCTGELE